MEVLESLAEGVWRWRLIVKGGIAGVVGLVMLVGLVHA